ncbi:MAG: tetratricopeptide repeat protein [Coraliomargarita sp.]
MYSKFKVLWAFTLCAFIVSFPRAIAQDPSQMGFTDLQSHANGLVEGGQLLQALPYLEELIRRVDGSDETDYSLDFPLFLTGTAYIQSYVNSNNAGDLNQALEWYDRLEKDYPKSPNVKLALLKRIDILRALKRTDDALKLMQDMLSGQRSVNLTQNERLEILKDLCQIYYGVGRLQEGLPYFGQLIQVARNVEDKSIGAAASFEGLIEAKRLDDAVRMLPILAKESDARYNPRLNVALLKASDTMVEQERYTDAALLLNLIKTTDVMIEFNEAKLADKNTVLQRLKDLGGSQERVDTLSQEVKVLEANLKMLRELPTLRNELLVRRARNFTKTGRRYESFWMFFDLMNENPEDKRAEFYHYAAFAGARQLSKDDTLLELGRSYRAKYPQGDYFSDVTAAYVTKLDELGKGSEALQVAVDFLDTRPADPFASTMLTIWVGKLLAQADYAGVVQQCTKWRGMHRGPVFEDGLYYWPAMAHLQSSNFAAAVQDLDALLTKFPTSVYAEDGLLRKGVCEFYLQDYASAEKTLLKYIEKYPSGSVADQAQYYMGEVESLKQNIRSALIRFGKADRLTTSQALHDACAFRIADLYMLEQRYDKMRDHLKEYIKTYGDAGQLSKANLLLGQAYEALNQPVKMLALYREMIERYALEPDNEGVDTLIEDYAEKYRTNLAKLQRTVQFIDQLENDLEFRNRMVTDRGALFEEFYLNPDLEQSLYNNLRMHPAFTEALLEDLTPIAEVLDVFRDQLADYPKETPADFFKRQLATYKAADERIGEARMLMGLYRSGVELDPSKPFDASFLQELTPRLLLYVADYSRLRNLDFAVETWTVLLNNYPNDDSTIVAYIRLADVSAELGDLKGALVYLDAILENFAGSPKVPMVILRQGELMTELGRYAEAREKYQYILRVPEWRGELHARALLQTGDAYMAEQAYAEAHGFYERTFLGYSHMSEWAAKAYLADAKALTAMGDAPGAKATLAEAVTSLEGTAPAELYQQLQDELRAL